MFKQRISAGSSWLSTKYRRIPPMPPGARYTLNVVCWLVALSSLGVATTYMAAILLWIWANPVLFAGGLAMVLALSVSIVWHELGHLVSGQWRKMQTPVFSLGIGPRKWSWLIGTTGKGDRAIEWIISVFVFLGGYVKIIGLDDELNTSKQAQDQAGNNPNPARVYKVWERSAVAFAGPMNNFILAFVIFAGVIFFQGKPVIDSTMVTQNTASHATIAPDAVFQPGDVFVSVDGRPVKSPESVVAAISAHKNAAVTVVVSRAGRHLTIAATVDKTGKTGVGLRPIFSFHKEGLVEAVVDGASATAVSTGKMYQGLLWLAHPSSAPAGLPPAATEVHGMVAMFQIGAVLFSRSIFSFLTFVANVNVMLAVVNLLPFPMLDGGYLMFFAIEKLRGGKPVNAKLRGRLMFVTVYLLSCLTAFALWNDIFHSFDLGLIH